MEGKMMDAISRSELIEFVKNRYHDIVAGGYPYNIVAYDLVRIIENAPALDVAPVVRCKDCVHNHGLVSGNGWCKDDIVCNYHMSDGYADDDFCSHGVRMDGEE